MATSGIIVMGEVLDWLDARIQPAVSSAADAVGERQRLEGWRLADYKR
jgi:hypothetical protein